ncbi:MAG: hypothetical protein HY885_07160 [Deltaproteobacteria bacterium]|nr:hypothetical protein [Deltaproteobacteria bacterium]
MEITFYQSALCPRCRMAGMALREIQKEYGDLVIREIEVMAQPHAALKAGIRMIPALTAGDRKLAGFILTRQKIREFVATLYRL